MIAIITDSTVSLTRQEARALGVRVLPIHYFIDGHTFEESSTDKTPEYETLLARCTDRGTSQVSVYCFTAAFVNLIQQGYDILCIVLSSRLGGTYSGANIAAKAIEASRIAVIDSLTTVGGLRLLIEQAAQLARRGYPLAQVVQEIEKTKEKVGVAFSVNDMDALRQSGRVNISKQSVTTILNTRPILTYQTGSISSCGIARGKREQIIKLADCVPQQAVKIIIQSQRRTAAMEMLYQELKRRFPKVEILCAPVGPVISINIGLDSLIVSWLV